MASSKPKSTKQSRGYINTRVIIGATGFVLSILLHELLHIIMHLHHIVGVQFFPDWFTVAELVVDLPPGYDLDSEEFIAYGISAAVLIITAILIAKVHDDSDKRTVSQILFPETKSIRPTTKQKRSTR
jgi:hypothetical protein